MEELKDYSAMSFTKQRQLILGYTYHSIPEERQRAYFDEYFTSFAKFYKESPLSYGKNWFFYLFPSSSDTKYLVLKTRELLAQIPEDDYVFRKKLHQKLDNLERVARVQKIEV